MKFGIPEPDFQRLSRVLRNYPQITKVLLFGSRAKGTFKPGSDIDLAIFAENPFEFNHWLDLQIEFDELDLPQKIDAIQVAKIQNQALLEHIERVGEVFYRKGEKD